jgi:hypothetical protein
MKGSMGAHAGRATSFCLLLANLVALDNRHSCMVRIRPTIT